MEVHLAGRGRSLALLVMLILATGSSAFAQAIAEGMNEVSTDFSLNTSTLSGVDANRTTELSWRLTYARFLSDRFAAGPVVAIRHDPASDVEAFSVGGLARVHFGDRGGRAIPFVEASSTRSFNEPFGMNRTDVQVSGGLVFPMGASGGRLRVAPYYYRAFYDLQEVPFSYFHSFGVSWSVALLF